MSDKPIDPIDYARHTEPSRQVLFDYFGEDFNQVTLIQTYLYQKGWKLIPIEKETK